VVLQAVGVLSVASIGRAPRGLHIGGRPWLGADCAQKRRRMEGARAHFGIERLHQHAASLGPKAVEGLDDVLKSQTCHVLAHHNYVSGWKSAGTPPDAPRRAGLPQNTVSDKDPGAGSHIARSSRCNGIE